jgi:AcrR family transcriptional regulator
VGRPREHDEQTAAALLAAAEATIQTRGIGALSLRELARDAGTTTRAVYSLYGSKDGLLGALGARAFELLLQGLEALPTSGDPREDLVEAALMFRQFALTHPALFSLSIQHPDPSLWPRFRSAASDALAVLHKRVEPLADAGSLGGRSVLEATLQFHSLCEGVAAVELRGISLPPDPEQFWRNAFHALITGLGDATPDEPDRTTRFAAPEAAEAR